MSAATVGDFSIFPTYLVSEMARRRVTVALSGDGGDEIFAGYEHYQAQRIARRFGVAAAGRVAHQVTRRMKPGELKKGPRNKLRRFTQAFENEARHRHLRWMMFLSGRDKAALYTGDLKSRLGGIRPIADRSPFRERFERLDGFDRTTGELYLDLKAYLPDDIMVKVDRMSMAVSLEAREPLLDHKLVEFAFRLPGSLKLRGLTTKWIFKKTLERLLPRDNITRKKEGFSIPIKHWLRVELRGLAEDLLGGDRIRRGGLFEPAEVRRMMDAHFDGRENYSHQLWSLLVFEIWRENYLAR